MFTYLFFHLRAVGPDRAFTWDQWGGFGTPLSRFQTGPGLGGLVWILLSSRARALSPSPLGNELSRGNIVKCECGREWGACWLFVWLFSLHDLTSEDRKWERNGFNGRWRMFSVLFHQQCCWNSTLEELLEYSVVHSSGVEIRKGVVTFWTGFVSVCVHSYGVSEDSEALISTSSPERCLNRLTSVTETKSDQPSNWF